MNFRRDIKLEIIANQKDYDELSDEADSGCTSGYDNDGSTGYEIFENGFELARKAGKKPVFAIWGDSGIFFFIGTKKSVMKRLQKLKNKE